MQIQFRAASLDRLVAADHQVRAVWAYACAADLTPLYEKIRAVEGGPGRPPIDPRILFALWLYATLDGVGAGRQVSRLCEEHQVYQWICGGVSVNYHALTDFRVDCGDVLEELLTAGIAGLLNQNLVTLNAVAQDGMRVRASAGASSFRRDEKLAKHLEAARNRMAALKQELHDDPASSSRRKDAAEKRAARELVERVERAIGEAEKIKAQKKKNNEKGVARASTTDPEARRMKMADGGFRPGLNTQFATDVESGMVVGVSVTSSGSDKGQLVPMIERLRKNYGRTPKEVLVDGDFITRENIALLAGPSYDIKIFAPVAKRRDGGDPFLPHRLDSPAVIAWRERMGSEAGQKRYRARASTAEWTNALARNRGLTRFLVRGLRKARAVALWFALAHNLMQERLIKATA